MVLVLGITPTAGAKFLPVGRHELEWSEDYLSLPLEAHKNDSIPLSFPPWPSSMYISNCRTNTHYFVFWVILNQKDGLPSMPHWQVFSESFSLKDNRTNSLFSHINVQPTCVIWVTPYVRWKKNREEFAPLSSGLMPQWHSYNRSDSFSC